MTQVLVAAGGFAEPALDGAALKRLRGVLPAGAAERVLAPGVAHEWHLDMVADDLVAVLPALGDELAIDLNLVPADGRRKAVLIACMAAMATTYSMVVMAMMSYTASLMTTSSMAAMAMTD